MIIKYLKFMLNTIHLITFFLFFYLFSSALFSQTDENTENFNSNEEIRAEFGNWFQVCEKEKNQCVALQFALNVEGERAARFVLEKLNKNDETVADSVITIFIPFESNVPILPNGITLTIDSNDPFNEQFLFCDQLGCTSQFGLTKQGINMLMKGANLTISMVDIRVPNEQYIVDIDLESFDLIYNEIITK